MFKIHFSGVGYKVDYICAIGRRCNLIPEGLMGDPCGGRGSEEQVGRSQYMKSCNKLVTVGKQKL